VGNGYPRNEGVRIMALEVTPEELNRFYHHLAIASHLGDNNAKIKPQREVEILQAIKENWSNMDIKRTFKTSDYTINRLKKQYGYWGA